MSGITPSFAAGMLLLTLAISTSPASASGGIDLTIDGVPFHTTRGDARDVRSIAIEDSPVRLILWDEPGTGDVPEAHYGISLDGHSLVRVTKTSYELGLGQVPFDPFF